VTLPRIGRWLPWLKPVASLALLWFVLQQTSSTALLASFQNAADRWPYLAFGVVVLVLTVLSSVSRWRVLLSSLGRSPRWRALFSAFMVGAFFNQFLPSTIGGDIVRGWWLREDVKSGALSIAVVAVDRFFGLIGLCALGLAAAAIQPDAVRRLPAFWIVVGMVCAGCLGFWILTRPITANFARTLSFFPLVDRVQEKAQVAYRGLRTLSQSRQTLLEALGLSLIVQFLIVAQYLVLSTALGLSINLWELAVLVPIVTVITWLPVTINGIGLREVSLVALSNNFGMVPSEAIALAWLFLLYTLPPGILGAAIYAIGKPKTEKPRAETPSI
jgi:glycosyltransferase 2 family protein